MPSESVVMVMVMFENSPDVALLVFAAGAYLMMLSMTAREIWREFVVSE